MRSYLPHNQRVVVLAVYLVGVMFSSTSTYSMGFCKTLMKICGLGKEETPSFRLLATIENGWHSIAGFGPDFSPLGLDSESKMQSPGLTASGRATPDIREHGAYGRSSGRGAFVLKLVVKPNTAGGPRDRMIFLQTWAMSQAQAVALRSTIQEKLGQALDSYSEVGNRASSDRDVVGEITREILAIGESMKKPEK